MSLPKTIRNDVESMKLVDLKDLHPFQGKLKDLSKANYRKLRTRIEELGFSEPFAVWQNKGRTFVLNGHQRLRTLQVMAGEGVLIPKLPAAFIRAKDEKEAKRKVLALTSQFGEMTGEGLFEFLTEAGIEWPEAKDSFRFPEIDFKRFESEFFTDPVVEDEVPEPPKVAITKPGDLWELGEHWLLCGDCKGAGLQAMEGRYDLLVTDPPYGVDYSSKNDFLNALDKGNRNQSPIENDSKKPEEMFGFWKESFAAIRSWANDGASYYVTGPQGGDLLLLLLQALSQAGFPLRHMLIWAKNNHVLGRSDYNYKHEPIIYGWVEGAHRFVGPSNEVSLWEIAKPQESKEHPTMKPVALYARAIRNSSAEGQWVCDPFAGSGTAVVASAQLNRRCYAIEIEPKYCDVIIERWEKLTGGKAKRASGQLGNVERATASRKRLEAKGVHL